jgi:hypothetical protein
MDFTQVHSPVWNDMSFRIVVIFMIILGFNAIIFDAMTAFLNGDLEEETQMDCPPGMEHDECPQLLKTMCSLVQSSRQCHMKFAGILKDIGFRQCRSDPCLFYRKDESGVCVVLTCIDGNLCVGNSAALKKVCEQAKQAGLEIMVEDKPNDCPSFEIRFNNDRTKAWIGQPHVIKKIKQVFGEEVSKKQVCGAPGMPGLGLVKAKEEQEKSQH